MALTAVFAAACRDCPPGQEPDVAIEEQTTARAGCGAGVAGPVPVAGCESVIVVTRTRSIDCVPSPDPLPAPSPGSFDPFQTAGYLWDIQSARAILELSRIDIGAGTLPFAATGPMTVTAFSASGSSVGQLSTTWSRAGSELAFANPEAVAGFMASTPVACGFEVAIRSGAGLPSGRHTAAVDLEYNGVAVDSFRRDFVFGGSGQIPLEVMGVE